MGGQRERAEGTERGGRHGGEEEGDKKKVKDPAPASPLPAHPSLSLSLSHASKRRITRSTQGGQDSGWV